MFQPKHQLEAAIDSANNNHYSPSQHDSIDIFYKSKVTQPKVCSMSDTSTPQLPDLISSTPHPARPTPMVTTSS